MAKVQVDALLDDIEQADLRQVVAQRLIQGKQFWRPLHARMDLWMSMYMLMDPIQQMKPLGYRRFISNEPRTAIDAAVSILTRNDSFFRIEQMAMPGENTEVRSTIGKIERTLDGMISDADELFTMRGEPRFWKAVSQQALLRGWIWTKWHITNAALEYRQSPLLMTVYDSRTVMPKFDQWGLNYVCIETVSTLGELVSLYPETFADFLDLKHDPNSPAIKVEYWSNNRPGRPGVTGVLGIAMPVSTGAGVNVYQNLGSFYENPLGLGKATDARWIIPPYRHGYTPEQLPIVGVPANGLSVRTKPSVHPMLASRLDDRMDRYGQQSTAWTGPGTWQADSGRGILSSVEDQVPQYNELVATILHHFALSAYGTWLFKTPTGEIPDFEPGIEGKVALRPEEDVKRIEIQPINADAYRLLGLIQDERAKGTLSSVLQASSSLPNFNSSVLFQQVSNVALNALEPYHDAMEMVGMLGGTSALEQMKAAGSALQPFEVVTQTRSRSYFRIEFDPKFDLDLHRKYKPVPVFKPALPDDLAIRINAAKLALDPKRPVLSMMYVLENILQVDDAQGELDRIWEDIANNDPVIVFEQIKNAMLRIGEPDMAARMEEQEFKTKFMEDLAFQQQAGSIPALGNGGGEQLPPGAGGGQTNAVQTGQGGEGGLAAMGAEVLGAMGETVS